jgi:arylformamidase
VGIKLVGFDYLSIEKLGSRDYAAHMALLEAGVVIVEGLDLSEVEPGEYDMVCLPLRIAGADGSPARVVLRPR